MRALVKVIALIFFLLMFTLAAHNVHATACTNAPRPRLAPNMAAVVAPGVDSLNLRALPAVETGIVGRLYQGTPLTIISGPSCNGGINWWRVELQDGIRGWVAEGTWLRYYVIPANEAPHPRDPLYVTCPPLMPRRCPLP